jgi:hypothetical protein
VADAESITIVGSSRIEAKAAVEGLLQDRVGGLEDKGREQDGRGAFVYLEWISMTQDRHHRLVNYKLTRNRHMAVL